MTPVNNTVIVAIVVSLLAAFVPLDKLVDMVSIGTLTAFIVVSIGVIILRVREPEPAARFKVPFYYVIHTASRNVHIPIIPILSVLACGYILLQPALVHLDRLQRLGFRGVGVLPAVGSAPQCAQRGGDGRDRIVRRRRGRDRAAEGTSQ